jgi:putative ABC transport system permease protein
VISYAVAQRTREFGIRMALGAQPANVFAMILGQGIRIAGLGIFLGLVAAAAVTCVMASLLFGVQPTAPLTFVAVPHAVDRRCAGRVLRGAPRSCTR